jgi:hypothetical protein
MQPLIEVVFFCALSETAPGLPSILRQIPISGGKPTLRAILLACLVCAAAPPPALAQFRAGWDGPPLAHGPLPRQPTRHGPGDVLPQLDVTPLLLEPPPPPAEPPRQRRPMFSQGWTRDGFGTQSGGWR